MRSRSVSWVLVSMLAIGCGGGSEEAPPAKPAAKPAPASQKAADDAEALTAEARALTDRFGAQLKAKLLEGIQSEGPAHAIAVCQEEAPGIAKAMSMDGWTIGRTAPRVRNPDNAPSDWQQRGLAHFQRTIAGANPPADIGTLEWHEVVERDGGRELHYMRAIPMGGLCSGCHGPAEELDAAVREQLAARYPEDRATGFAVGQLRGAFVVTKSL